MNWRACVSRGLWLGATLVVGQEALQVAEIDGWISISTEPVIHQKLAELLVFTGLLLAPAPVADLPRPSWPRLTAWVGAIGSLLSWFVLNGLTPWAWWCLVLALIGLLTPWATKHVRWRRVIVGGAITGYLAAMVFGYAIGSGYYWYPSTLR